MKGAVLLVAMLGVAHYAAATGDIHDLLNKQHMPSSAPAPPVVVSGPRQCLTVPELATADGNFTALLAAAKAAGLDGVLADPELSGTLFAPTDAAFAKLLKVLGVSADELLAQKDLLVKVLSYHFSPAVYTTAQMYDGQKLPTLLSADATGAAFTASLLTVDKVKAMEFHPYQQTTEVSIIPSGGAPAAIIKPDIPACKVLVQVVDAVLIPDLTPKEPAIAGMPSGIYGKH
ncbi:hypothetical protein N2152v2_002284 [Parachlorella kessleri]